MSPITRAIRSMLRRHYRGVPFRSQTSGNRIIVWALDSIDRGPLEARILETLQRLAVPKTPSFEVRPYL